MPPGSVSFRLVVRQQLVIAILVRDQNAASPRAVLHGAHPVRSHLIYEGSPLKIQGDIAVAKPARRMPIIRGQPDNLNPLRHEAAFVIDELRHDVAVTKNSECMMYVSNVRNGRQEITIASLGRGTNAEFGPVVLELFRHVVGPASWERPGPCIIIADWPRRWLAGSQWQRQPGFPAR